MFYEMKEQEGFHAAAADVSLKSVGNTLKSLTLKWIIYPGRFFQLIDDKYFLLRLHIFNNLSRILFVVICPCVFELLWVWWCPTFPKWRINGRNIYLCSANTTYVKRILIVMSFVFRPITGLDHPFHQVNLATLLDNGPESGAINWLDIPRYPVLQQVQL